MSVPEPERHKGRMEVHVKAQSLAAHTAKIVGNPNVFNPENDPLLIEEIKWYARSILCASSLRGVSISGW